MYVLRFVVVSLVAIVFMLKAMGLSLSLAPLGIVPVVLEHSLVIVAFYMDKKNLIPFMLHL